MSSDTLIIIEMAMVVVLCLGFGFQQLWSLRQDKKRTLAARQSAAEQADSNKV
jgi:hypothetical protein